MSAKLLAGVAAIACFAISAQAQTILTAETAAPNTTPGISIISLSEAAAKEGVADCCWSANRCSEAGGVKGAAAGVVAIGSAERTAGVSAAR